MRNVPKQIDDLFYSGQRSDQVPFALNDDVLILEGPHSGSTGAVISIASAHPVVSLVIECGGTGDDVILPADAVRLVRADAESD